jgi:hypothetical protein
MSKFGVDDGARTHDHRNHNPGLYQLSYAHHKNCFSNRKLARPAGLEPATLGLEGRCSIRLSYGRSLPINHSTGQLVGVEGFEPPTPCSQSRCATRLRYTPQHIKTEHACSSERIMIGLAANIVNGLFPSPRCSSRIVLQDNPRFYQLIANPIGFGPVFRFTGSDALFDQGVYL